MSEHPGILAAFVIGVPNRYYGEVPGAFIQLDLRNKTPRPPFEELRRWTSERIGKHKSPQDVFVFGENGVPDAVPVTGSGKVQKHELREISRRVLHLSTVG